MAADMFLKIDGIDGESLDAKHKGEIEIESFSWGASSPTAAPGGGGGGGATGRVTMEDFSFTTRVTRASPKLLLALVEHRRIKTALLTVRRSGGQQHDFLKVTMSDVQISGWKQAGGAELPMDQVSMNFRKVQIDYTGQRPDGTPGDTVTGGWDSKNTKI
jgi:type VI secretion system secreted protein Hcp